MATKYILPLRHKFSRHGYPWPQVQQNIILPPVQFNCVSVRFLSGEPNIPTPESSSKQSLPSETELYSILTKMFGDNGSVGSIPLSFAIGYGSGVFSQSSLLNNSADNPPFPMIDLILGVPDSVTFHRVNLARNPHHYAGVASLLNPETISSIERTGGGAWFNPYAPVSTSFGPRTVKYGVITACNLLADLTDWNGLYIAGRMQKPTKEVMVVPDQADSFRAAVKANLRAALAAGLLLLPPEPFSLSSRLERSNIYSSIATISYRGDVRLLFGAEDPNKVRKLVSTDGAADRWDFLYEPQLARLESKGLLTLCEDGYILTNLGDSRVREQLVEDLPMRYQQIGISREKLEKSLAETVRKSSGWQAAKGLVTAGMARSMKYTIEKLAKGKQKKI